jgi:hypothetical protein
VPPLEENEVAIAHNNLGLQIYEAVQQPAGGGGEGAHASHTSAAVASLHASRAAEAEQHFRLSIRAAEEAHVRSFWYPHKNLGQLLEDAGRTAEAAAHFAAAAGGLLRL